VAKSGVEEGDLGLDLPFMHPDARIVKGEGVPFGSQADTYDVIRPEFECGF
jgi:hypothetical protein